MEGAVFSINFFTHFKGRSARVHFFLDENTLCVVQRLLPPTFTPQELWQTNSLLSFDFMTRANWWLTSDETDFIQYKKKIIDWLYQIHWFCLRHVIGDDGNVKWNRWKSVFHFHLKIRRRERVWHSVVCVCWKGIFQHEKNGVHRWIKDGKIHNGFEKRNRKW